MSYLRVFRIYMIYISLIIITIVMLSQYLPTIPHRRRVSESLHVNNALQRPISRHKLPIRQSKQDMIFQTSV